MAITEDGYRVVQVGEEIEASDEVVTANPSLFSEPAATAPAKKRTTKKT